MRQQVVWCEVHRVLVRGRDQTTSSLLQDFSASTPFAPTSHAGTVAKPLPRNGATRASCHKVKKKRSLACRTSYGLKHRANRLGVEGGDG